MRRSIPITDHSILVAVAALGRAGWYLIALDPRLRPLHRAGFAGPAETERAALHLLRHARRQESHAHA
jgi:hypothetical protein